MATPDRLARLLKNAAQVPPEPIDPLAAGRADDVVRAWRAARTPPQSEELPWLGFAWRGVAAACAVMIATCAIYASAPETSTIAQVDESSLASDPELFVADSATLLALQP